MLTTNTNFDTYHNQDDKVPMYLVKFDGVSTHFCNLPPKNPTGTLKEYLSNISGGAQSIDPENGRSSIAALTVDILDVNGDVTSLIGGDSYNWHRKDVDILAGYFGMDESDMLAIGIGAVTSIRDKNGSAYSIGVTDVKKWLQKEIFTGATEDSPVTVQGNVINVLLSILTSTGNGTNGSYDKYPEAWGVGIDSSYIETSYIENKRDTHYPGLSHYVKITMTEPVKAKNFIETELLKAVTNAFLAINGQGHLTMITYKPSLASTDQTLVLTEDKIKGIPQWTAGFEKMINHVEFHYDHDYVDDEFDTIEVHLDTSSISNRGPGQNKLKIESKGLHSSLSPSSLPSFTSDIIERRKNAIFARFSDPPPNTLKVNCYFGTYLAEAGDIAEVTHSKIPDLENGVRGITSRRMQIVNRTVNWASGYVTFDLLDSEFGRGQYRAISPSMTITNGISTTAFDVSTADAAKYANFTNPVVKVLDSHMRQRVANITISDVNTSTGRITTSSMGLTPSAGDFVVFDDYDNKTAEQKKYGAIADSSNYLGSSNDAAHIIAP